MSLLHEKMHFLYHVFIFLSLPKRFLNTFHKSVYFSRVFFIPLLLTKIHSQQEVKFILIHFYLFNLKVDSVRAVLKKDLDLPLAEIADPNAHLDGGDVLFTGK